MAGEGPSKRSLVRSVHGFLAAIAVIAAGLPIGCLLWRRRTDDAQSCANCRSFTRFALSAYSTAYDGWFPFGGKDEWDSLAKCIDDQNPAYLFTSHALAQKAEAYWKATRSLSEEVCCYRYNEGLRDGDPGGLILLYFARPTRWECREHYVGKLGRPCFTTSWAWEWKNEEEFQKLQARTRAFLLERRTKPKPPSSAVAPSSPRSP